MNVGRMIRTPAMTWLPAVFGMALGGSQACGGEGGAGVSFNRDVRPILSEHCFRCHGPDANARKAGLRVERKDGVVAVLESGSAA
ncbi:c-type cytochrome domain-containing protein, partial [Singulisphaera rosea]